MSKETSTIVDQSSDPHDHLPDIIEAYCCALDESFHNSTYYYARSMKTVYFWLTVNSERVTYKTAVDKVHGIRRLRDGYSVVMLVTCHQLRTVEDLR